MFAFSARLRGIALSVVPLRPLVVRCSHIRGFVRLRPEARARVSVQEGSQGISNTSLLSDSCNPRRARSDRETATARTASSFTPHHGVEQARVRNQFVLTRPYREGCDRPG